MPKDYLEQFFDGLLSESPLAPRWRDVRFARRHSRPRRKTHIQLHLVTSLPIWTRTRARAVTEY